MWSNSARFGILTYGLIRSEENGILPLSKQERGSKQETTEKVNGKELLIFDAMQLSPVQHVDLRDYSLKV